MQLVQSQPTIADFNADLIQAQREALNALREVMAETADPTDDDNTRLDDDDLQTRTARFRRLSLRLRAATAILRVKPLTDEGSLETSACNSAKPALNTPREVPTTTHAVLSRTEPQPRVQTTPPHPGPVSPPIATRETVGTPQTQFARPAHQSNRA